MKLSRREFIFSAISGITGFLLGGKKLFSAEGIKEYRVLKGIGRKVSVFGFGSTKPLSPEIVEYAIDRGINYIDTAFSYQGGRSEEVIGQVMKRRRKEVFLVTKLDPRAWRRRDLKEAFHESLNTSLRRLQTDHVDAILAHNVKSAAQLAREELYEFFDEAKRAGKVSYLGFSYHRNWEDILTESLRHPEISLILFPFWAIMEEPGYRLLMENYRKGKALVGMKTRLAFIKLNLAGSEECQFDQRRPHRSKLSLRYRLSAATLGLGMKEMSCLLVSMPTYQQVDAFVRASGQRYRGPCSNLPQHLSFLLS